MGVEEFIADSIIILDMKLDGDRISRGLVLWKMRGTSHDLSYHPFLIDEKGVTVLPMSKR